MYIVYFVRSFCKESETFLMNTIFSCKLLNGFEIYIDKYIYIYIYIIYISVCVSFLEISHNISYQLFKISYILILANLQRQFLIFNFNFLMNPHLRIFNNNLASMFTDTFVDFLLDDVSVTSSM